MSTVTAKVKLGAKTPYKVRIDGEDVVDQIGLNFYADYEDGRNKAWAKYTPAISVTMTVKPEVAEWFNEGESFTLAFMHSEPTVSSPDA